MPQYKRVRRLEDGQIDPECEVARTWAEAIQVAHDPKQCPDREAAVVALLPALLEARWIEAFIQLAWPGLFGPNSAYHDEFWGWWAGIERGESPDALVACWPRGGGKSSSLTLMFALTCLLGLREYCIWVGAIAEDTKEKVAGVADLLSEPRVRAAFPEQTKPYVNPATGQPVDQTQGQVSFAHFTLEAKGIDQALRGKLRLTKRPGLVALDDIEEEFQTERMRTKVERRITKAIIPMGSRDVAFVWVQNRINDETLMAKMLGDKLDWFRRRKVSGPWQQVTGLEVEMEERGEGRPAEYVIVAGEATWDGQNLEISEHQINDEGLGAFLTEKQHESDQTEGVMFPRALAQYADAVPGDLVVCRAWDLASTEGAGDFTVGVLMGWSPGEGVLYVIDVARGQWGIEKVEANVHDLGVADREEYGRYRIAIEDQPSAAGKAWRSHWEKDVLPGFVTEFRPPQGKKEWRADALSGRWRKGQVRMVRAEWNRAFVAEFALFGTPLSRHDDQVDAVALGFNFLTGKARKSTGSLGAPARRRRG